MYLVPLWSERHVQIVVDEDLLAGRDVALRQHADDEAEPGVVYPREPVQGDTSCCSLGSVDIKTKVAI